MSNYRRLISYIYAYEGGIKGRNIGYAKIEVRSGQCRIYVSVKKIYIGSNDIGVYLLTPGAELMLGRIFIRSGSGEFRINIPAENIDGKGCTMDQCYGLTIHDVENTWQCYTTIWEDAVAHVAEVELAEVTAENARKRDAEQEKTSEAAETAQDSQPHLPISAEIEQELEKEEENLKDVKPWQAEEGTADMAEQSVKENGDGIQQPIPEDPFRELPPEIPSVLPEQTSVEPSAEVTAESIAEPPAEFIAEPPAESFTEMSVKPYAAEPVQKNILKVLQEALVKVPRTAPKPSPERPPETAQERGPERPPETAQERGPERPQKTAQERGPERPPETAQERWPERPSETVQEVRPSSSAAPEPEDPLRLEELDRLERQASSQNDIWSRMQRRYAKVLAFEYDNGCEILSIKPQDIGLLPREIWVYGNNSFLLHGYYNYRHLILAKLNNPQGNPRFLLGVPGHYFSNEKHMASMFGFPHFVLAKKQPQGDGRFGYWYTDIRL